MTDLKKLAKKYGHFADMTVASARHALEEYERAEGENRLMPYPYNRKCQRDLIKMYREIIAVKS